jgi:hypothetical protein
MSQITPPGYFSRLASWGYEGLGSQLEPIKTLIPTPYQFVIIAIRELIFIQTIHRFIPFEYRANGEQPNLPVPQPIAESAPPLTKRTVVWGVPIYEQLAVADRELADDDICGIYRWVPEQPVLYDSHVYEYVAFAEWYRINGTDPITRAKIDISQLKRLIRNNNQ